MTHSKKIIAYVVLLALVAYVLGISAFAFMTGDMRGRFGNTYHFSDHPFSFLFGIVGNLIVLTLLIFALYVLRYHERFFSLKLAQIWQRYRDFQRPRR